MTAPVFGPPPLDNALEGPDRRITTPWARWLRQLWHTVDQNLLPSNLVTLAGTQTLTNKTIDGDNNTIQDIGLTQIKSTARATAATVDTLAQRNSSGDLYARKFVSNFDVRAIYKLASAQALTAGGLTVINFSTMVADTHSAVTTGANWKFTCPPGGAGPYRISSTVTTFPSDAAAYACFSVVYTGTGGGAAAEYCSLGGANSISNGSIGINGSALIDLAETQWIQIVVYCTHLSATTQAHGPANHIFIERLPGA